MAFSPINRFRRFRIETINEFYSNIETLLENERVKELDNFVQHYCFTRLQHSLDVAYYSFFLSKLFGWDSRSVARAGLLHDLFLYDRHADGDIVEHHWRTHPVVALENARGICELNEIEEDIIRKHMWLVTLKPPRYKEGFVVTFVDKYCALREFAIGVFLRDEYVGRKDPHSRKQAAA